MPSDVPPDLKPIRLTSPECASLRQHNPDELSQPELEQLAKLHVDINPDTSWQTVDPALRNAVIRAAYELGCRLYISAGQEGGHAKASFHRFGKAVDISRVNGEPLSRMAPARRLALAHAIGIAVMRFLPPHRYAELYSPAIAMRLDKSVPGAKLKAILGQHTDHIHISVR